MIEACIKQYIDIDNQSLKRIISKFRYRYNEKGEHLLKVGNRSSALFFIKSGYLQLFNSADGKEITLWVGTSGQFVTSVSSFVFQSENIWNIQFLTASEVLVIKRNDHFELCDKEPR
ncbi:MAG TPA: Crp/Fnr family transcriptional regulator [Cyclobacteriaceae bacterium]